jgi:uridine phosphorylase
MALGMDVLMNFYQRNLSERESRLKKYTDDYFDESNVSSKFKAYSSEASSFLVKAFESLSSFKGITVTASGFYGPQSRKLRAATEVPDLYNLFDNFEFDGLSVTNLEMETAGIYGMSSILGHNAISLNAILANRKKGTFSTHPDKIVDNLILKSLEIISDKIIL